MLLNLVLTLILTPVAIIHALWGMGIWFPIREEEALARAVVGARSATRMPGPIPCFLVAGALLFVVIVVWGPDRGIIQFVLGCAALAFLGRGVLAYTRIWRRMTPEQPFARFDQLYYGPLCLVLALLLILRITTG